MVLDNGIEIKNSEIIEAAIRNAKACRARPRVAVRCITYNQEAFIAECLEGFVSQKTDFPFVAVIHDDASTDNTPAIIDQYATKYPDIIIPVCDNQNRHSEHTLSFVMDILIDAYQPDFIAFCEGDDYWTDPYKLQKQVDYLDAHPECVMCHGDHIVINGQKRKTPPHYDDEPFFGPGHVHVYPITSLTAVYRYSAYKNTPHYGHRHSNWLMGDKPLWIELSREGKFHYFPEVFGAYRVLENSASHSTNCEKIIQFWENENLINKFYCDLYGFEYRDLPKKTLYRRIQKQCFSSGDKQQAKKYWLEARASHSNDAISSLFYFCNITGMRSVIRLLYRFVK